MSLSYRRLLLANAAVLILSYLSADISRPVDGPMGEAGGVRSIDSATDTFPTAEWVTKRTRPGSPLYSSGPAGTGMSVENHASTSDEFRMAAACDGPDIYGTRQSIARVCEIADP